MAHKVLIEGLDRVPFRPESNDSTKTNDPVVVDLDDAATRRHLSNYRGEFYTVPVTDVRLQYAGSVAAAGTASILAFRAPKKMNIVGVSTSVGATVAGTAASVEMVVDVHKAASRTAAGSSIFTGGGSVDTNKPNVAAGAFSGYSTSLAIAEVNEGEWLRAEVDTSGPKKSDLTVTLHLASL